MVVSATVVIASAMVVAATVIVATMVVVASAAVPVRASGGAAVRGVSRSTINRSVVAIAPVVIAAAPVAVVTMPTEVGTPAAIAVDPRVVGPVEVQPGSVLQVVVTRAVVPVIDVDNDSGLVDDDRVIHDNGRTMDDDWTGDGGADVHVTASAAGESRERENGEAEIHFGLHIQAIPF